jgi:hypothetical protein
MARPQIHDCSKHLITLCPETKQIILHKLAEMSTNRASTSYSDVIDKIVNEYDEIKKGKAA